VLNKIAINGKADILHETIEIYQLAHKAETYLHAHDIKEESATKS
jgi:hypothetical protein